MFSFNPRISSANSFCIFFLATRETLQEIRSLTKNPRILKFITYATIPSPLSFFVFFRIDTFSKEKQTFIYIFWYSMIPYKITNPIKVQQSAPSYAAHDEFVNQTFIFSVILLASKCRSERLALNKFTY